MTPTAQEIFRTRSLCSRLYEFCPGICTITMW